MFRTFRLGALAVLSASAGFAAEAAPLNSAQVLDLEHRLRRMQVLMDQMELQAEDTKASLDKAKPQPISFGKGQLLLQQVLHGPSFETAGGAQLLLGFNLDPLPQVHGDVEVQILGAVAADRTLPQLELAQFYDEKQRVLLKRSEIRFEDESVLLRAFRMVPRPDLFEDGDMFYLFPAADDTNKYFRQSGRTVPSGSELAVRSGWLKGLELWAGDELIYGVNKPTGFARYRSKVGAVDFALMGLWVQDPKFESGHIVSHDQEAWLRVPLFKSGFSADLAAVRRATKVGQSYSVTKKVAPGSGELGTDTAVEQVVTTEPDAWGALLRLRGMNALPGVEEASLTLNYSAPLAGNVQNVSGLLSFRPQRYTLLSLEGVWQTPIVGPGSQPVIIGTPSLNLGTVPGTGPRPYGSIVSVSQDPVSGANNREMTTATVTLEFNPGQGWFYKWRPRIVDAWNFNTDLQTPFSNVLSAHGFNYPSGTDLGSFIDAGERIAEETGSSGLYPTNGWRFKFSDILAFRAGPTQWWLVGAYGDQISGLSPNDFADTTRAFANQYLSGDISVRWKGWLASAGYAENVYGPDDWYRTFGLIIGSVTRASLSYKAGASEVSAQYVGWRDKDPSKMHFSGATAPENPPHLAQAPLDQLMLSYALNF